jgi:hypothetical protein
MSVLVRTLLEAETISAREFMRAAVMREEELRAAMRAASQASLARRTALRQEPGRQEPGRQEPGRQEPGRQEPMHQEPSASGNRRPDSSLSNHGAAGGQSEVRGLGRARPAKPTRSTKSKIVPEPDQLQSEPPVRPTLPHRT